MWISAIYYLYKTPYGKSVYNCAKVVYKYLEN